MKIVQIETHPNITTYSCDVVRPPDQRLLKTHLRFNLAFTHRQRCEYLPERLLLMSRLFRIHAGWGINLQHVIYTIIIRFII